MLEIIAILCLIGAVAILIALSIIDLREGLLPNELVLGFLAMGLTFHLSTMFTYLTMEQMGLGCFIGLATLYLIRAVANKIYNQDALGLGDVKLLGAAGLWLGPEYILTAMAVGALMGIFHGLGIAAVVWKRTGEIPALNSLSLPAGPGFAAGIVIVGIFEFWNFLKVFP